MPFVDVSIQRLTIEQIDLFSLYPATDLNYLAIQNKCNDQSSVPIVFESELLLLIQDHYKYT